MSKLMSYLEKIQGPVLGPISYDISSDSLLRSIKVKSGAFANDLKFAIDNVTVTKEEAQDDVNSV